MWRYRQSGATTALNIITEREENDIESNIRIHRKKAKLSGLTAPSHKDHFDAAAISFQPETRRLGQLGEPPARLSQLFFSRVDSGIVGFVMMLRVLS